MALGIFNCAGRPQEVYLKVMVIMAKLPSKCGFNLSYTSVDESPLKTVRCPDENLHVDLLLLRS